MNNAIQNSIETFERLMDKYSFSEPVEPDIQDYALLTSKINLKKLLKTTGNYSLVFGAVLFVYGFVKKIGLTITFFQSKILVGLFAASIGITAVGAGGVAVKYIAEKISTTGDKKVQSLDNNSYLELNEQAEKLRASTGRFYIGVNDFKGTDYKLANTVSTLIAIELVELVGPNKVSLIKYADRKRADKIVMGSIRQLGIQKIITVRIVNVQNARTEYATTEKITGIKELERACKKISERISKRFR